MSTPIIIERSSYEDERAGYPVRVKVLDDNGSSSAILTIEEAKQAIEQLQETIKELEEAR